MVSEYRSNAWRRGAPTWPADGAQGPVMRWPFNARQRLSRRWTGRRLTRRRSGRCTAGNQATARLLTIARGPADRATVHRWEKATPSGAAAPSSSPIRPDRPDRTQVWSSVYRGRRRIKRLRGTFQKVMQGPGEPARFALVEPVKQGAEQRCSSPQPTGPARGGEAPA